MPRQIVIDPVTRIEGHAKITIHLDNSGQVADARFHVGEFRGFEKFCEGRPLWEMAGITARVCGICPVSHLLASSKAADAILAVRIPPAAEKLRRLMNLSQIIQSHALSFFHLSAPDLLLGMESDPARRNLFGLAAAEPEFARGGIRLRQFGQEIIEHLGGKKIHPTWTIPGGVRSPLSRESAEAIRGRLSEAFAYITTAISRFKLILDQFQDDAATFGSFPSLFLSLVSSSGEWEHYDGVIRVVDAEGHTVADGINPTRFEEFLAEKIESNSYLKSPYWRKLGYPDGMYRVGPLARLNVCDRFGTARADAELAEYRSRAGRIVLSSFYYHYARLIEILGALEQIEIHLDDEELFSNRVRSEAGINRLEGVGVSEAPRGTLFHHYQVNEHGMIQRVNLLIATGQNNLAMNKTVAQIARHSIRGPNITEGTLNRIEAGIRAFDPCLSCSTHALGQMALHVQLFDWQGRLLDEARRA